MEFEATPFAQLARRGLYVAVTIDFSYGPFLLLPLASKFKSKMIHSGCSQPLYSDMKIKLPRTILQRN